jgi:class 3 adenylate cyclase/tetratricopeptide (TPR) repeat protein
MRCFKCGSDNPQGLKFCNQCGAAFKALCSKCGFENVPGSRFCGECGASLNSAETTSTSAERDSAAAAAASQPRLQVGERRHLTVLFCDLMGSTELTAQLDPEEWQEMVAAYHRTTAEAVRRFDGQVAKFLGDGVMAYFGYPEAHDNDAERAARAGLAILEAISKLNQEALPRSASPKSRNVGGKTRPKLSARVGIDSGPVVVGAGEGTGTDIFGEAPNIAARVQAVATPDTVVISAATHRLVVGLFEVEDYGAHTLKGIEQPMQLYRVIQPAAARGRLAALAASRGLTPFVGREDELHLLKSRWQRVLDGEGQVVLISGEAGIGKSRLVQQFRRQIEETPHAWIEAAAAPFYQNTPFYPVAEALWKLVWEQSLNRFGDYLRELQKQESGQDSSDVATEPAGDDRLDDLQSGLISAGLEPAEALPLIAPLMHLPLSGNYSPSALAPEQQRRRLLATLIDWLLGTARSQPLVIVIEDLHWADPSTLELIQLLLEQGATARMLLLYTTRPEYRPGWPLRPHHTQITLNRLTASNVREMIAQVAAQNALGNETLDAVVERTSGVPLFVEELTRAVLESGNAMISGREIPVTLHDSLMARLDRLGSAKEVLQIGSVIGSEFSYHLLQAVHPLNDQELQSELHRLTDADLLYVRGIAPGATYQFKHALIRDAAYEALLKSRRKELHGRVARTIDERFPDLKEAHPEVLARHWTEAGETDAAIPLWDKVGDAFRSRCSFGEAYEAYRNALALLELLPQSRERDERELSIRTTQTAVLQIIRGYSAPETIEAGARARVLSEKLGNPGQLTLQSWNRWAALSSAGDFIAASRIAEEMFDVASRDGDRVNLAYAHMALMTCRYRLSDLVGAEYYFVRGRDYFDNETFRKVPGAVAQTFGNASLVALLTGLADTARDRIRQANSSALHGNSPYDQAFSQFMAAMLHLFLREPRQAQDLAASSLTICEKYKFPQFTALCRIALGRARAELGDPHGGVELIRQGAAEMLATKNRNAISVYLHWLSEAMMFSGEITGAIESVEKALSEDPAHYFRSENLRLRGELRQKQGDIKLAEADFRESIALAQRMGAKAWELRSTMSLARLLGDQGRREEARTMLAEIYNWFTEGFDTPDLKDAQALLHKLGA